MHIIFHTIALISFHFYVLHIIQTIIMTSYIIPQLQHQAGDILVLAFSCLITRYLNSQEFFFILKTSLLIFANLVFFSLSSSWFMIPFTNDNLISLLSLRKFISAKKMNILCTIKDKLHFLKKLLFFYWIEFFLFFVQFFPNKTAMVFDRNLSCLLNFVVTVMWLDLNNFVIYWSWVVIQLVGNSEYLLEKLRVWMMAQETRGALW